MWTPTNVQLIVSKARNLKIKGKSGTNDCYAVIQFGKEKYQTSIKEKCIHPEWNEECDFFIPEGKHDLKVCLYHRNLIGMDDFLGQTEISLNQFNIYERPRKRWFPLFCKPSSKKQNRFRGEIELMAIFLVNNTSTSVSDFHKNNKPLKTLSFKNIANNIGNKLNFNWPSRSSLSGKSDLSSGNFSAQSVSQKSLVENCHQQETTKAKASSSVASLVEDSKDSAVHSKRTSFESCNNNSSQLSHVQATEEILPPLSVFAPSEFGKDVSWNKCKFNEKLNEPSNSEKFYDKIRKIKEAAPLSLRSNTMNQGQQIAMYELHEMEEYRRNIQESLQQNENLLFTEDVVEIFKSFPHEDLIHLIADQKQQLTRKDEYIKDLEDYIDNLLVKVIETQPKLLQKPCNGFSSPIQSNTPLNSVMCYSTIPRKYSHTSSSMSQNSTYYNKRKFRFSIWRRGSTAMSPFKKLQALIK